ncbi:MAG: hypothetical protein EA417_08095 [Gammaproteobacteria bacterium]|nr:MAG: hypothetical protein EA417_08095 [Gammaproteobacteria bacterium]
MTEAVIQFQYALGAATPAAAAAAATLAPLLQHAQALGVMGRDPDRYDSIAFGNLSFGPAAGHGFWITATQTADQPILNQEDVILIKDFSIADNSLRASGRRPPSSETLSHAAIHGRRSGLPTWVLHGHAPALWARARAAPEPGLWTVTDPRAANGTVAMAQAIAAATTGASGLIVMGGHQDGVLAYGPDAAAVLALLTSVLEAT